MENNLVNVNLFLVIFNQVHVHKKVNVHHRMSGNSLESDKSFWGTPTPSGHCLSPGFQLKEDPLHINGNKLTLKTVSHVLRGSDQINVILST